jgi:iron complex outermembrane receptor protein
MAAFYNKLNNQQLQVSYLVAGAFNQSLVNIGQSHVSGLEIDSAMRIYHALRLDVSAAYLHTQIVQIGNANAVGADLPAALQPFYHFASGPTLHAPLPNVPNWRVAVTGSYDLPVPTHYGDPSIGLTMVHTGQQFFTSQDGYTPPGGKQNYLPAITLLNANFDWHAMGGSPFDLAIFCTNLFDKNYITHYLGGYNATGFESGRQGEPRMFGARITYRFGAMGNK